MDEQFAECVRLYQRGDAHECIKKALGFLADHPDDLDAQFLLGLIANLSSTAEQLEGIFDALLQGDHRTADGYERIAHGLRAANMEKLARVAFKTAAARDRENPNRPNPWGEKPFNGQEKRTAFFRALNERVKIDAVVERPHHFARKRIQFAEAMR